MNGPGTSQSTEVSTEKLKGFIIKAVKHAYFGSRLNIRLETKGPKDLQGHFNSHSANQNTSGLTRFAEPTS